MFFKFNPEKIKRLAGDKKIQVDFAIENPSQVSSHLNEAFFEIIIGILLLLGLYFFGELILNFETENILIQFILAIIRFPLFFIWWPILGLGLIINGLDHYRRNRI